jgi:hypothetical protein
MLIQHLSATDYLIWGIVLHLVSDWGFQNHWQAANKTSLLHPAARVHSGIHLAFYLLLFPWPVALGIAVVHLLIDTRVPLVWWRTIIKQTMDGPIAMHCAIWLDQVVHIFVVKYRPLKETACP